MPKVIIFDFDGVIVDSLKPAYNTWTENGADLTLNDYRKRFEGNINHAEKPVDNLDFFSAYENKVPSLTIFSGISNVISDLAQNYTLTINSSTVSHIIKQILENYKLDQYFDSIFGNDIATSKVEKIKLALNRYQATPDQTIMITDTLGDLREANEAGIKTIAVTWGFHNPATLQKGNPTAIANQPTEIPKQVDKLLNPLS